MHEMGIVLHLAKTLDRTAEEEGLSRISRVTLQVGEVSGIVTDLFVDAWNYFSPRLTRNAMTAILRTRHTGTPM